MCFKLFSISTSVDNFVIAKIVYRRCVVSIGSKETVVDLFELDMVDFDVILGMEFFSFALCFLRLSDL